MLVADLQTPENPQRITKTGQIYVAEYVRAIRYLLLLGLGIFLVITGYEALKYGDPFIIYSTIVPIHSLLLFFGAWILYRNPANGKLENELVSVVIPIYNQESMIRIVIDAIFHSTYSNVEVIAVNDGSRDGTKEVLDELAKQYRRLKVVHKKNAGKRKAIGSGFAASKGKYIVFIDSDSVVDRRAIEEFVKTFSSDKTIGAVVGNAKAWNARKSLLTKLQDVWYDLQFNVHKACESAFGLVLCCSGCLCAYRRESLDSFIQHWITADFVSGDDREITTFVIAKKWSKRELLPHFSQTRLEYASKFDDSEDRILTAQALLQWKAVYVASAVVFTDVPESLRGFIKQQVRWKRGYLRSQFFVSTFFWHNNPVMVFIFYLEYMTCLTMPFILFTVFVYAPFFEHQAIFSVYYLAGTLLTGVLEAFDSKARNRNSITWKYKPLMAVMSNLVLSWLVINAWVTLKNNKWGTR